MKIAFKKVTRNGSETKFIAVSGVETATISGVAHQLCVESTSVIRDVLDLPDNRKILSFIWNRWALLFLQNMENTAEQGDRLRSWLLSFRDEDETYNLSKEGEIENPSEYLSRELVRYPYGVSLAINFGADFEGWNFPLTQGPLILRPDLDQSQWNQCRLSHSLANRNSEKANRYKAAVQNLAPYLDRMEDLIDQYEQTAQNWSDHKGQSYLQGLATLNLVERMTDIYSRSDRSVGPINRLAKETMDNCGAIVQNTLLWEVRQPIQQMATFYFDQGFLKTLFEYLKLWDPSDHYYFHTVVANSVGAPKKKEGKSNSFDDRVFKAIEDLARYLSADGATAKSVAEEVKRLSAKLAPIITGLAKQGKLGSNTPLQNLLAQAEKFLSDIQSDGGSGILTVLTTWSGYVGSWLGTMEGPPTLAGIVSLHFSKSANFVIALERRSLLDMVQMIGVEKPRLARMTDLVERGREEDLKAARDLFIRSSWRSRSIFTLFTFFGLATLVFHVDGLCEKLQAGGDRSKFDAELVKLILYLTSDVSNLGLVALTFKYNRDLNAFLTSNLKASTEAVTAHMESLDAPGWRTISVSVLHKSVAAIGVVLSFWDFSGNWSKSDALEKAVLFCTIGASLAMFLGSFGATAWMGPPGAVIGFILGVITVVHAWFKSGFENAIRSLMDGFADNALYQENLHYRIVAKTADAARTDTRALKDLGDKLHDSITSFHWGRPDRVMAVEYLRAGITDESLAKIYECDLDDLREQIRKVWYKEAKYQARTAETKIELVSPEFGTRLIVGALSPVRVVVYNGDNVGHVCMDPQPQWWDGDPDRYLANDLDDARSSGGSSYDIDRKMVVLNVDGHGTGAIAVFNGSLLIHDMPPEGVARFYINAPKAARKPPGDHSEEWKAQLLVEFPVVK